MMFWYGGGWAFWQVAVMWVAMIGFWALVIWGIWAAVTGASRRRGGPEGTGGNSEGGSALRILDERLARGEIDAEEYRRLREVLAGGDGRRPAGTGGGR